ncbi:MAG: addiction module toxin, HicA family [Coleofasciculaceae cyanobacterium SM2_1_6]|nr:addiction module toxin, HicA family [Coleofasciculaceae cyanobacterium SM2_1_6]
MPKIPRLAAKEAETLLFRANFNLLRSDGSHRIYGKDNQRVVIPFHTGKTLHPKIIKQVIRATQTEDV